MVVLALSDGLVAVLVNSRGCGLYVGLEVEGYDEVVVTV